MLLFFSALASLSLASIALCSPHKSHHVHPKNESAHPCAQVGAELAKENKTINGFVPAQLAYDCLTSIPFHQNDAVKLMDSLHPYIQWQSGIAWTAKPPPEYVEKLWPPYDFWSAFHNIRDKAVAGSHKSEYEFNMELFEIIMKVRDGHFLYWPDFLFKVFGFFGNTALVSVSADGKELSQVYVSSDIRREVLENITWTPSHVTHINGLDATMYLKNKSEKVNFHDHDALWNLMFSSLAGSSPGGGNFYNGAFTGSGPSQVYYQGANLTMTFANGTSWTRPTTAWVRASFEGVTDGESLYQKHFVNPENPDTNFTQDPFDGPVPGYPPAVAHTSSYELSGYYLADDYSDIAVLSVPSFTGNLSDFQSKASSFIAGAKQAGKKKLVIDLQSNYGGFLFAAIDLYQILFPTKSDLAPANQLRVFDDARFLFEKFSAAGSDLVTVFNSTNATLDETRSYVIEYVYNYRTDVDANGKPFTSWQQKYGPIEANGDTFSSLLKWDINSPQVPDYSGGIYMHSASGPFANYTDTPFAPEDIILVTDGSCGSSCSIFADRMRQSAGVKVISLGGRPQSGITQAQGIMRGTFVQSSSAMQFLMQYALANFTSPEEAARLNNTGLRKYYDDTHSVKSYGGGGLSINMYHAIRHGDTSFTPLQYIYDPADCRILYTKEMTVDVTTIWTAAADSAWGSKNHCVAGSVAQAESASLHKRQLNDIEKMLSSNLAAWRASLKPSDYVPDAAEEAARLSSVKPWNGLQGIRHSF